MVLLGCTPPSRIGPLEKHERPIASPLGDSGPLTILEVVSPAAESEFECWPPKDPEPAPLELLWARRLWGRAQWNQRGVLVTCHAPMDQRGYLIRFFQQRGRGFVFAHRMCFGEGYLEQAEEFTVGRHRFMFFRHKSGGSSAAWYCRVVWLGPAYGQGDGASGFREIDIEQPVSALSHLIRDSQHSETHRTSIELTSGRLRFRFHVWNQNGNNNFPTGGYVDGLLKVSLDEHGRPARFIVDPLQVTPSLQR